MFNAKTAKELTAKAKESKEQKFNADVQEIIDNILKEIESIASKGDSVLILSNTLPNYQSKLFNCGWNDLPPRIKPAGTKVADTLIELGFTIVYREFSMDLEIRW
jgi:hypothetical protein